MRIINIISNTNAYVSIRDLNLKPGAAGTIDVDILIVSELKSLRNLSMANDIIISESDFNYIVNKIVSMSGGSGSGGDAPVKSVNTEIGDVVLDASNIKVADGDTIQEEFEQLSPVAYSGNYLDLINRPQGSGSSDVITAGTNAVSGDAVTSFVDGDDALNVVAGKLNVVVSPVGDNILQKNADGLYVPTPVILSPETIASNLQSSTTEVVNGTTLSVKRSTDADNSLELRSNGLYVPPVTAPILDYDLSSSETGRAPTSYTVYNALNSDTIYVTGGKAEVKLSALASNRLVDSGTGLYVGPEPVSTAIDQAVHSAVSSSAVYNALTSNTISFDNEKANVKIENPASSSVQINASVNGISAVLKNIVKLESVRETVSHSTGVGTRYLSLTNFNIFVIDCSGSSGAVLLNGLNDLDDNQAKTITIIIKNATALTWASEFAWVDNAPPTLQPSTTLVVTGIYASNASSATYTGGKVLCTFSYYTV